MDAMVTYHPPSPRYAGPAARHGAADNKPIKRIVFHSTVTPTSAGWADRVAAMFRTSVRDASAHYVVDAGGPLQVVYDSVVAYHAPPNRGSLGIEMCDMPSATSKARWDDHDHDLLFEHVAQLAASLSLAYDIPPRYRTFVGLRLGLGGFTTHRQVSLAWHETTHWDPGAWPRRKMMKRIRAIRASLIAQAAA